MSITEPRTTARWRRSVLVVLAVGQLVSSGLANLFGGAFTTSDRPGEPAIVPAGWAFSIWGLIMLLSLGWAVWADRAAPSDDPADDTVDRLVTPLLLVFAGFSAWIASAEVEPVWATVVVFVVMLAGLLVACRVALARHDVVRTWSRTGRWLLWTLLGLYTGWSSVAIWLNLTTALVASGAPVTGAIGVAGQLGVLAAAVATAATLVQRARRVPGLALSGAAAVTWAFAGATVGAAAAGEPLLALAAGIGTGLVAGLALALLLGVREHAVPPTRTVPSAAPVEHGVTS
ncbi:hypothetical protein [Actinomycetospora lemnae]|uniref:Tryptophan-rich sensory protein n=1 Tax=Actinomycetospora lemnae TaxID=3019891 RepID=A0ABT5SUQ2_9PSEU|nr:hypothetical protein [Actinomycetospora sp. DW7H6]MDD7966185.1 hypothetical protein [Actinomycetospora sp. DW7H6]